MDDLDRMAERKLRMIGDPHVEHHEQRIDRYKRGRLGVMALLVASYPWLLAVVWMTAQQTRASDLGISLLVTTSFAVAAIGNWWAWQHLVDTDTAAIGRLSDGQKCRSHYANCGAWGGYS